MIRTLASLSVSLLGTRIFNHNFISTDTAFAILVHTVCFPPDEFCEANLRKKVQDGISQGGRNHPDITCHILPAVDESTT